MPTIVGLGPQAQHVSGVFGDSVSVQNRGLENVYVSSDSSVSPANGWVLPGLGTLTWKGGVDLWACTDPGGKASLIVSDSALQVFTPGPDHVTIDGGTVNISNASIPISGTVDIASGTINAVIDGPVEINGGTVNVGGAVAVTSTFATIGTLPPGRSSTGNFGGAASTSRYFAPTAKGDGSGNPVVSANPGTNAKATGGNLQTLVVNVPSIAAIPNGSLLNLASTQVTFYTDATFSTPILTDTCSWFEYGGVEWAIPIRSQYFSIASSPAGAFPSGGTAWTATYLASTIVIERSYMSMCPGGPSPYAFGSIVTPGGGSVTGQNIGIQTGTAGARIATPVNAAGVDSFFLIPSRSGQVNFFLELIAANMQVILFSGDAQGNTYNSFGSILYRTGQAVAGVVPNAQLTTPEAPMILAVRSTSGAQAVSANVAFAWPK